MELYDSTSTRSIIVQVIFAISLRPCWENGFQVAQATRLCRPATRRTEWEQRFEPIGTCFPHDCSPQFRSAGRRPERASRPRYLFLKRALSPPGGGRSTPPSDHSNECPHHQVDGLDFDTAGAR